MLNGRAVSLRGVGLHEDDPSAGFAIDSARRAQIVAQAKELGATVIRSHYPLHPEMHELADRLGLLVWSEIPVYAVKTQYLKREACASSPRASSRTTSSPTRTTRRSCSGRSATSCPRGRGRCSSSTSSARCARPRRWTRRAGRARRRRLPVGRLPAAVRGARRHRHQRVLRLVPGPQRPDRRPRRAVRLPGLRPRLLSEQGDLRLGVRRRGQPRRSRRGEGHLPVPAGLRRTTTSRCTARSRG